MVENRPKVFVYGEVGLDNIIRVPFLPQPEKAAEVFADSYEIGGAGSNVAVLLADWGLHIGISGNVLGDDWFGREMRSRLSLISNLDLTYLETQHTAASPYCRILVTPDGARSTLFYHSRNLPMTQLTRSMLDGATILALDLNGGEERLEAGRLAYDAGLTVVVGDLYDPDHPLTSISQVITNSAGIIRREIPNADPRDVAQTLHQASGGIIVTSDGPNPVHVIRHDGTTFWVVPPKITPKDTTGAGDALKAGVIYGLAQDWPIEEAVRWGVAAGTLNVERFGASSCPPTVSELEKILDSVQIRRGL